MILVMGVTGSGKSFFVNRVAANSVVEGATLKAGKSGTLVRSFVLNNRDRDGIMPSRRGRSRKPRSRHC
jgi:predicted GTPase